MALQVVVKLFASIHFLIIGLLCSCLKRSAIRYFCVRHDNDNKVLTLCQVFLELSKWSGKTINDKPEGRNHPLLYYLSGLDDLQ